MPPQDHPRTTRPTSSARRAMSLAVVAVAMFVAFAPASAQTACREEGKNMQCNQFGTISMENQRDIKGTPITVDVETTIYDTYADQGARWILFSVRHEPRGDSSPVSLSLVGFKSAYGDVVTTRIEREVPNEINAWVHVVDVPTNTPITMSVKVGSTERGAFQLESLVMPFDRGYEPLSTQGEDLSLFAYTLLGVNGETGRVGGGGSFIDGVRTPGLALPAIAGALAVAFIMRRRLA